MAVSDYVTYDIAQPIHEGYFDKKEYPHIISTKLRVEMYRYTPYTVIFEQDISDQILDYSYECDYSASPKQQASITLKVDKDDQHWYMRRENKMREWYNPEQSSINSIFWEPQLYRLTKLYKYDAATRKKPVEIDFGFFVPISNSYDYDSTTGSLSISLTGMSANFTKEYGGGVTTLRIGTTYTDPDTHEKVTKYLPTTLSVGKDAAIDGDLFYNLAMGSYTSSLGYRAESMPVPIKYASVSGQDVWQVPYDLEFDADVCVQDMFDKIIDIAYQGRDPSLWIDENRVLRVETKPKTRVTPIMYWRQYQDIVISENVSYNDSGFYNITEVYGKDNSVYAVCEQNTLDSYIFSRKQVISDDTLETVEECQDRADWETYKERYGRMSITVTLADSYISAFKNPSCKVGQLIEYSTIDGDTNMYFLNKLTNNGENWTMELSLFRPLYDTDDMRVRKTLAIPTISKHEVIENNGEYTLRLYVTGDDVGVAVAKVYYSLSSWFLDESADTDGTYSLAWKDSGAYKIVDIPITKNGRYRLMAALYSPWYEDSGLSDTYTAVITEIKTTAVATDPDPYPHPDEFEPVEAHEPYLLNNKSANMVTEDSDNITT